MEDNLLDKLSKLKRYDYNTHQSVIGWKDLEELLKEDEEPAKETPSAADIVLDFLIDYSCNSRPIGAAWRLHDDDRNTEPLTVEAWKAYRQLDSQEEAEVLIKLGNYIKNYWEERGY